MREIELKPSRLLGVLLAGMAALALIAVWLAALPAVAKLGAGGVLAGLAAWGWRRSRPGVGLRLSAGGRLQGLDETGEWREIEVLGDSFVSPLMIVLRCRIGGGPAHSLTLLPDSAAADDLRRLRVSLRWTPRTRSDTGSRDAG